MTDTLLGIGSTGLVSVTEQLDEAPDLLRRLPPGGIAWVRGGEGFVAWGEVARIDPGPGRDRFRRAWEVAASLLESADMRNPVGVPGSGPVAFGSFTFDPDSPGSSVVIPAVVVGRAGGRAWVTRVGAGRIPNPAAAAGPPASASPTPASESVSTRVRPLVTST